MKKQLPDVAFEQVTFKNLDWVGMDSIEVPISIKTQDQVMTIPAKARGQVSLDLTSARGIHMSRLFLEIQKISESPVTGVALKSALMGFLQSHSELSSKAILELSFQIPLKRQALKSEHSAWRNYPVKISALSSEGKVSLFTEVLVTYSSTCPASAALARQLIEQQFQKDFLATPSKQEVSQWLRSPQGIVATPHAQRSEARVKVEVQSEFEIERLINLVETALQTPVQAAVKREDEQEFALRNGQNLMFCEDAARKVASALQDAPGVMDFLAEFHHFESLHPHNAVSRVSKGLRLKVFDL